MAKISARGAKELIRYTATRYTQGGSEIKRFYVVTDDGRALFKDTGEFGPYTWRLYGRKFTPESLAEQLTRYGWTLQTETRQS